MTTAIRYFLSPSGELIGREEPGRCDRYWSLWGRRLEIEQAIAARPDKPRLDLLQGDLREAMEVINTHLDVCPICRAWLDRSDEVGVEGWMKVLHRENREEQYLNPFGLRPGIPQTKEVTA
jgi:hypothetical protein